MTTGGEINKRPKNQGDMGNTASSFAFSLSCAQIGQVIHTLISLDIFMRRASQELYARTPPI